MPKLAFAKDNKEVVVAEDNCSSSKNSNSEFKISVDDPEMLEAVEKEHKRKYLKIEVTDKYPEASKDEEKSETKAIKSEINSKKKSFIASKSYEDSLALAKAYYAKGQYLEAEKWALVTNNINSKLEEGWLIFAKAKVKMGDKDEAIEVLNVYVKKTDSPSAKKLLLDIENGKI
ncbi:Transformation system protein [hydrothermal vent metagenome]|uniref:Transformation system protein n=1 Tax=hydrothermal vent metagenome TaxID=652676 RepID=A0A1W1BI16_9ZZZZ